MLSVLDATLLGMFVAIGVCAVLLAAHMLGREDVPTERHRLRATPMMTPDAHGYGRAPDEIRKSTFSRLRGGSLIIGEARWLRCHSRV